MLLLFPPPPHTHTSYDMSVKSKEMWGVWLSESPNARDGVGGWQPPTRNESAHTHGLIGHACNECVSAIRSLKTTRHSHEHAHSLPHTDRNRERQDYIVTLVRCPEEKAHTSSIEHVGSCSLHPDFLHIRTATLTRNMPMYTTTHIRYLQEKLLS